MFNKMLAEIATVKQGCLPVDLNGGAVVGARISLAKGDKLSILVSMGDSTAAVADFTLQQHNAASAGTSKALSVANPYFYKKGAETKLTKVEPVAAASNYVLSTQFANDEGVVIFEINGDDLDVDGGFAWASLDIADSTAAKLGAMVYVLSNVRFSPAYSLVV